jgi:sulfur-carrier protein
MSNLMPTIQLYANLRTTAGTKELSVTGTNLRGVLNELANRVPALEGVILENGQIRPHFVITVNGLNATDLDTALSEEDVVAIFPPIAGG